MNGDADDHFHLEVRSLGEHYALLHSTVPSYNEPMALGTSAAISLGLHQFGRTRQALTDLKGYTASSDKYAAAISQEASADYLDTQKSKRRMDVRRQAMGRI
jgi:hypothetical protein